MAQNLQDQVNALIRTEDTILHDAWKAADIKVPYAGIGGSAFLRGWQGFGEVETQADRDNRAAYVHLANTWLAQATPIFNGTEVPGVNWAGFQSTYEKILIRRDSLVKQGYGNPTAGAEDQIMDAAEKFVRDNDWLKEYGAMALVGLALLVVIVILK